MNFVLLTGPPAVGKMTIGQQLVEKLDYKLFHNHLSIELALNISWYGSKEFKAINEGIRDLVFKTVSKSKDIKGFIFTLVWAFDEKEDWDYFENIKAQFVENGWTIYIVELEASQEVRLQRNNTPNRLKQKPSKRNIEKSTENLIKSDTKYVLNTDGTQIKEEHYLKIENSHKTAEAVADEIIAYFGFVKK